TFNKSPLFMNATSNESMPARFREQGLIIEFEKIEQSGNICYSSFLDEDDTKKVAKTSTQKGFQLDYKKVTAITIKEGRVVLNPDDQLFKEAYEYIDIDMIGLPESFPQKWMEYEPEMSMSKYFGQVSEK
ncbi:MAG: hypothetical protein QNK33_09900, partial [Bacteroidales bacterium]|nr:hypothetical protein [Bacteroidales bacterium]